jgi:hypothetical protein
VALRVSALRFFYLKVLKKYALRYELPYPNNRKWARRLPTILTPEEMIRRVPAQPPAHSHPPVRHRSPGPPEHAKAGSAGHH